MNLPTTIQASKRTREQVKADLLAVKKIAANLALELKIMKEQTERAIIPACPVCGGKSRQVGSKGYYCRQDNGFCGVLVCKDISKPTKRSSGGVKRIVFHETATSMSRDSSMAEWLARALNEDTEVFCLRTGQPITKDNYVASFNGVQLK